MNDFVQELTENIFKAIIRSLDDVPPEPKSYQADPLVYEIALSEDMSPETQLKIPASPGKSRLSVDVVVEDIGHFGEYFRLTPTVGQDGSR